jgi:hypothetical protein
VTVGGDHPGARGRERGRKRSPSLGRRIVGWIVRLAVIAAVFYGGLAVGRALEDAPSPGGTQTIVRTLEPLTVEPRERTVTVTTSGR